MWKVFIFKVLDTKVQTKRSRTQKQSKGATKMKQTLYNWLVVIIFAVVVGLAGTSDIAQYI